MRPVRGPSSPFGGLGHAVLLGSLVFRTEPGLGAFRVRNSRRMPSRGDINPAHIPRLLPFVFLAEVLERPRDFRYRLAGTHFREFVGIEPTGRRIAEVFPP